MHSNIAALLYSAYNAMQEDYNIKGNTKDNMSSNLPMNLTFDNWPWKSEGFIFFPQLTCVQSLINMYSLTLS